MPSAAKRISEDAEIVSQDITLEVEAEKVQVGAFDALKPAGGVKRPPRAIRRVRVAVVIDIPSRKPVLKIFMTKMHIRNRCARLESPGGGCTF